LPTSELLKAGIVASLVLEKGTYSTINEPGGSVLTNDRDQAKMAIAYIKGPTVINLGLKRKMFLNKP
jgi:hypothetical protein